MYLYITILSLNCTNIINLARVRLYHRVTISFLNILSLIVKGNVTSCLPPVDLLRKMADLVTAYMLA